MWWSISITICQTIGINKNLQHISFELIMYNVFTYLIYNIWIYNNFYYHMTHHMVKMFFIFLFFWSETTSIIINAFFSVIWFYISSIELSYMVYKVKEYLFVWDKIYNSSVSSPNRPLMLIFIQAPTTHLPCEWLRTCALFPISLIVITSL